MEKYFAYFGVMPDYIWFVNKRIRKEYITNYNLALNLAHRGYQAYYNAYKQHRTEHQNGMMKALDLALPSHLPWGKDEIHLSVCNEILSTTIRKSKQQKYQKTAMLVNKCYYRLLKKYYGKKNQKEILEMVMIEMRMKSKKWNNKSHH